MKFLYGRDVAAQGKAVYHAQPQGLRRTLHNGRA
jgi:hypothetical protein